MAQQSKFPSLEGEVLSNYLGREIEFSSSESEGLCQTTTTIAGITEIIDANSGKEIAIITPLVFEGESFIPKFRPQLGHSLLITQLV